MRRLSVRLSAALAALAFVVVGSVAGLAPGAAAATSVPYSDPNAVGYLGFCDAADHQVTSGSILTQPFVVKTVASTPAPSHYGPPYGRAVLYVYQPIQYVDPSDWSGKQLTAASAFTNTKAPMTVATQRDPSMINFSSVYPLHVDGFAEVRMYFTALGQTQFSRTYPAANIRISGHTWTQVGGGKVNCKAGQVHSNEIALGAPTTIPTKSSTGSPTKAAGSSSAPTSGTSGSESSLASSAAGSASHHSSSSSNSGLVVVLTVLAVLAVGGGGYVFLRRRSRTVG